MNVPVLQIERTVAAGTVVPSFRANAGALHARGRESLWRSRRACRTRRLFCRALSAKYLIRYSFAPWLPASLSTGSPDWQLALMMPHHVRPEPPHFRRSGASDAGTRSRPAHVSRPPFLPAATLTGIKGVIPSMHARFVLLLAVSTGLFAQTGPVNPDFEKASPGSVPDGWFVTGYDSSWTTEGCLQVKACAQIVPKAYPGVPKLTTAKGIVFDLRGYPVVSPAWLSHVTR